MWALAPLAALLAPRGPVSTPLQWDAPPGCPEAAQVQGHLNTLLGDHALQLEARAQVQAHRGRWTAELTVGWRGHTDRRRLDADDCTSLAQAIALLVAVMADPIQTSHRIDERRAVRMSAAPEPPAMATQGVRRASTPSLRDRPSTRGANESRRGASARTPGEPERFPASGSTRGEPGRLPESGSTGEEPERLPPSGSTGEARRATTSGEPPRSSASDSDGEVGPAAPSGEPPRFSAFGSNDDARDAAASGEPQRGLALALAMLVDGGTLPRVTPAPLIGLAWGGPRGRLLAELLVLPPRRVRSSASYGQGRVLMGAGRLGGCAHLVVGPRAWLPLCGAAELGGITAVRFGQTQQRGATNLWIAGVTHGSLVLDLGRRLSLTAGLEMAVPLRRIEYRHQGERLHGTAPVALRGRAGLELRWGAQRSAEPENR